MAGQVNTVDTSAFNAFCKQGARMSAVPFEPFVRNEVGRILEKTVSYVKVARKGAIRARQASAQFTQQPFSLYSPQLHKGERVGWKGAPVKPTAKGFLKYNLDFRYPSTLWAAIQERRAESLKRKLAAVGLAKKSFWKIAEQLGIQINVPDYVPTATPSTGQQFADTTVRVTKNEQRVEIFISNSQPTAVNYCDGAGALQRAINGRVEFFLRNIKLRVFNDVAKIAKAYPGIKTYLNNVS